MKQNQPWSKHEAAILLDAYIMINNNEITKKAAIKTVSTKLRIMGSNLGLIISQTYRNENGIQFQLQSMESAFHNKRIVKPATALFKEIVKLYRTRNGEFEKILREAKAMLNQQDSKSISFFEWLSTKMPSSQAENLCKCLKIAEDFCIKTKVLTNTLINTTDPQILKKFQRTIEQNNIFRIVNIKNYNNILYSIKEFNVFTNETISNQSTKERNPNIAETTSISERDVYTALESLNKYGFSVDVYQICDKMRLNADSYKIIINILDKADWVIKEPYKSNSFRYKLRDNIIKESSQAITIGKHLNITDSQKPEQKLKKAYNSNGYSTTFYNWMLETQKMAEATCRSYLSAINTAEQFAKDNGLQNTNLFVSDYLLAKATYDELFESSDFIKMNNQQHNRFRSAINKLLVYIKNDVTTNFEVLKIDLEPYKQILLENFPKGFRLASTLELRKFKKYWQLLNNEELTIDDASIYLNIQKCGVIYEDKLFLPEIMLEQNLSDQLFEYIRDEFDGGKSVLYYESIFKEFSNAFLNQSIYNAKMLKAYLEFSNNGYYFVNRSYISKDSKTTVDIVDEVRNYLLGKPYPTNYNDMFEGLSHIPELKIRQALACNDEFVYNGKYEYFHVDSFLVDDEDLLCISNLISDTIQEKEFISGNELLNVLRHKCPHILEYNAEFSEVGIRDAIAYKLKDKFSFKGNIISELGQDLSMATVFENFCKSKTNFTLNELKVLKNELKTVIYFDSVYNNSLRISEIEFVSKDQARFNTDETDKAIDKFCDGDYIPIKRITQFGLFPDAGFIWNSYLLEHYVAVYSANYKLVHTNYNETACVGAIVKRLSDVDTFDEVLIDVIANSNQPLTRKNALQYFCDEGYLARRSYSKIEEVLLKAKELRNQKG